ncbi:MAG: family 16 glycosylhydrolase [Luteibaculaceae bacterium]
MQQFFLFLAVSLITSISLNAQILEDDFETSPPNLAWQADAIQLNVFFNNPLVNSDNASQRVLRYHDTGGLFANVRFTYPYGIDLTQSQTFSFKIYVPSSGVTGSQPNQVSLKLQNSSIQQPWVTQTEIIKPIILDAWQEVSFDFLNDPFINYNAGSADPINRNDFNRVLIQVNGENNTDHVLAFIDDFFFDGGEIPIYDQLVWNDEFDVNGPVNSDKWFHQTILPNGFSWFNNEIQHYTNRIENSFVNDGKLSIVAIREQHLQQGILKQFTSARLNSKFAFTYGKVEVRAKLPTGVGTWPAIWTLGKNINELGAYWQTQGFGTTSWPACGEIDIMEHWGSNQNFVQSATHTPSSFGATENHGGQVIPTVSTDFHTYQLWWYPNKLVFAVDDVIHFTYQPAVRNAETWPFDDDQFLLLNIAIEPSIAPSFMQGAMEIEYVRVYQETSVTTNITEKVQEKPKAEVFPNPAQNTTNLTVNEALLGQVFSLFNLQGQLIKNYRITDLTTTLSLEQLTPGMYILKSNESHLHFKIIKAP